MKIKLTAFRTITMHGLESLNSIGIVALLAVFLTSAFEVKEQPATLSNEARLKLEQILGNTVLPLDAPILDEVKAEMTFQGVPLDPS